MKANLFLLPKLILSPGGKITLNIFEPRYLDLLDDCIKNGTPMAIGHASTDGLKEEGIKVPHECYKEVYREVGIGEPQVLTDTQQGSKIIVVNGLCKGVIDQVDCDPKGFLKVDVQEVSYQDQLETQQTFLYRRLKCLAKERVRELLKNEKEVEILMNNLRSPNELVAFYSDHLMNSFDERLTIFKENDINQKLQLIGQYLVA